MIMKKHRRISLDQSKAAGILQLVCSSLRLFDHP